MVGTKKLSVGLLLSVVVAFIVGVTFLSPVGNAVDEAKDVSILVNSDSEFNEGAFINTTSDSGVRLESTETQGSYESKVYTTTGTDWNDTIVQVTLSNPSNSSLNATVKTSDNQFTSVKDSKQVSLSDGTNTLDVSAYESEDVKVIFDFARDNNTISQPKVTSFEFTGTGTGVTTHLLSYVGVFIVLALIVFGAKNMIGL